MYQGSHESHVRFSPQYSVSCDNLSNLPKVTITLAGQDFVLEGKDYVVQVSLRPNYGSVP